MEANIDGQRKVAYNTGGASWNPAQTQSPKTVRGYYRTTLH